MSEQKILTVRETANLVGKFEESLRENLGASIREEKTIAEGIDSLWQPYRDEAAAQYFKQRPNLKDNRDISFETREKIDTLAMAIAKQKNPNLDDEMEKSSNRLSKIVAQRSETLNEIGSCREVRQELNCLLPMAAIKFKLEPAKVDNFGSKELDSVKKQLGEIEKNLGQKMNLGGNDFSPGFKK